MPRVKRRRLASSSHTERTRLRLLSGHDLAFMGDDPPLDDDELAEAWTDLRDELLADFIASHPGSRPWAWWAFDAPEPRRQIAPGPAAVGPDLWFGLPRLYAAVSPHAMYESERDYLARHGLLTDGERLSLAAK